MKKKTTLTSFLLLAFFLSFIPQAHSRVHNHTGHTRSVTVTQLNPTTVVITSTKDKAVLHLKSFNIAANETVLVVEPSATSSLLIKVKGGFASTIAGSLDANGILFLVNTAGLNFTSTSKINAASFIASTLNISTKDFMNGNYVFEHQAGSAYAPIINAGTIKANNITLIASAVNNTGIITAKAGTVNLASGDKVAVSFDQNSLINVEVNAQTSGSVVDANGVSIKDAVANSGNITAAYVYMTAQTAKNIFKNAVNQSGVVKATGIAEHNGVIELTGNDDIQASGTLDAGSGSVKVQTPGNISVNAALNTTGNTTIAAGQNINVNADVTTTSGNLSLLADNDFDGVGSFLQTPGTTISTVNFGDITIQASGASSLANIHSAGDLILKQAGTPVIFTEQPGSTITTQGSLTINPGVTLIAGDTLYNIGKNWANLGNFIPGTSTVSLTGSNVADIIGSNNFYNLVINAPEKIVAVEPGTIQQVFGILTLKGTYGQLLTIDSMISGQQWSLAPFGNTDIAYLLIGDSNDIRGPPLATTQSSSLGNNTNVYTDPFWTGQGQTNNWSDSNNWDTGTAPTQFDTVTFDGITGTNPNKNSTLDAPFKIANLTMDGYSGIITLADNLIVTGNVTINSGTLNAVSKIISIGGNWALGNGIFNAGTSTVVFNDAAKISNITGNNTFYNLKIETPGKVLSFESGTLTTVSNLLTIEGASGNNVVLKSSEPGVGHEFSLYVNAVSDAAGQHQVEYLTVNDSIALGPVLPIQATAGTITKTDAPGWDADYYWVGAISGSWSNASNWASVSGGAGGAGVPGLGDTVYFDANSGSVAALITSPVTVTNLYVGYTTNSTTTSTFAGSINLFANLTVSGAYKQNSGTFNETKPYNGSSTDQNTYTLSAGTFTKTAGTFNNGTGATRGGTLSTRIANETEFAGINSNVTYNYVQDGPITLATLYTTALINSSFSGTYNGSGYTISNFRVNASSGEIGLFASLNGSAIISNLGLVKVNINGSGTTGPVGAIAGGNSGTILNCYASGTVSGDVDVGGLVGQNSGGTINSSYSTVTVSGLSGANYIGGLVGYHVTGLIINSYATGSVTASNGMYEGGLVGSGAGDITNSFATGNVNGGTFLEGGLVGYQTGGNVTNSYSTGFVSPGAGASWVGGFMGYNSGVLTNCYWLTTSIANGTTSLGGNAGSGSPTGESAPSAFYNSGLGVYSGWTFNTNHWTTPSYGGYPYLAWQVIHISSVAQLEAIPTGDLSAIYSLENSLTLTGDFTSYIIGTSSSNPFTGTFNGNGYTISGLSISASGTNDVALFGYISNANISNIGLVGVNITGHNYVAGLVGQNSGGTITNSYVTGNVTSSSSWEAGLVAQNSGTISGCYTNVTVSGLSETGGLVGQSISGAISNSYSAGSVNGGQFVGGLVGENDSSSTITNTYSTASVIGSISDIAGLVGWNQGPIYNSFSVGTVTGAGSDMGGLVGHNGSSVNNSGWWTGAGPSYAIASSSSNVTYNEPAQSAFYGSSLGVYTVSPVWDVTSAPVWDSFASTYPHLHWEAFVAGITISGTIYTNENESTNVGSGVSVGLSVNGGAVTGVTTGSGGTFSFAPITISANNPFSIFIDDSSNVANYISQAVDSATNITGIAMFTNDIVLSHQTAGPMTNALLATAAGSGDSHIKYSVDGSNNATFNSAYKVYIPSGKTYTPGGTVTLGNITILGTFLPQANTVNVSGNWGNNAGTFTSAGTVNFNGTGAQSIGGSSATTFDNLTINKSSGTATLAINTPITGNLNIAAGTLDLSTYTADRSSSGGTLTLGANTTLDIGGTNTLPSNYSTESISSSSTIDYDGTAQSVAALNSSQNYGNLTIAGSGTKTSAGSLNVTGALTVAAGTLNMVTYDLAVGSVSNSGTIRTQSTDTAPLTSGLTWGGTVQYDATAGLQKIVSGTYNVLTLGNTGGTDTATGAISTSTLNTTSGGTLDMSTYDLTATSISNSGTIRTEDTGSTPLPTGKTWGGTVKYDATSGSQTVMAGTYSALTIGGASGTDTASAAGTIIATTLNTTAYGTFDLNGQSLTVIGTLTNSGTLKLTGSESPSIGTFTDNGITNYYGTGSYTIAPLGAYNTLTFSNSSGTDTFSGAIIAAALNTTAGGILNMSTHDLTAVTVNNSGTIRTQDISSTPLPSGKTWGGTVVYAASAGSQTVVAGNYNNITLSGAGTKALAGNVGVLGNWTNTGGAFSANSGAVTFTGTGSHTITSGTSSSFNNLTVNSSDGTGVWTLQTAMTVSGTLTATDGTLAIAGQNVSTGPLLLNGGTITGTTGVLTGTSYAVQSGAISAILGGTGVALTKTTSGTVTLSGNNTYTGLTSISAGTLVISGDESLASGGMTLTGGTLDINSATALGTGLFTVSGGVIDNTSAGVIIDTENNAQLWSGAFTFIGTHDLNIGTGGVTLGASSAVTVNAGTLTVEGAVSDSGNGYGLTKAGTGTLSLTDSVNIGGNFTISAGEILANSSIITVGGDWVNSVGASGFNAGTGTVILNGSTISGSNTFYNLSATTPGEVLTFTDGTTQTVTHALTLTGTANAPVVINDIGGGTTPKLTLNPGAAQDINNVNVTNNDASGGVELVAGGTSTLSGITTNWLLGANGATVVWTGTSSTDWNDPTNWNLGIVPSSIDTVVIPQGAPHQPVSPSSEATGNVALNGTLDAGSSSVTVNGNITGGSDGTITGADPSFNVDGYIGTIDDPVNTAVSGTISWNALGMQDLLSISLAGTGNYAFGTAIPGFVFINGILDNNAGQGAFRNSLTGGESPLTHLNPSIPAPLNSFHKEKLILFLPGSLPGVSAGRIVEF